MTLTRGQELAKEQLSEIARRSDGVLELLEEPVEAAAGILRVRVSISTRGYRAPGGLAFRDRERMVLLVAGEFPFRVPTLWFDHRRFAGAPHVQWGRYVCLYQSVEAEWRPADGMYGFMERVDQWLAAAGAGRLDPDDAPLHPPVAYVGSATTVVARVDAPAVGGDVWIGRADLVAVRPGRLDLVGWASLTDWDAVPLQGTAAAAVLLSRPLPIEFPSRVNELLDSLEPAGVSFGLIWPVLRLVAVMTPVGVPGHLVLGAPMRRRAAGEPLRQHLTVWEIDAEALERLRLYIRAGDDEAERRGAVAEWMVTAPVGWCVVLEDRPEIVNRRDRGTVATGLAGKAVALLGCGALGSAVAEMAVRAGASRLLLIDDGIVRPGVLVRQRFADGDIGRGKAAALKDRLDSLGLGVPVEARTSDLKTGVLASLEAFGPGLVVDATASRAVAHRLEGELDGGRLECPLISMSVSAAAEHGSVAVRMPGHPGGPLAVERAAKLAALARDRGSTLVRSFWPEEPPPLFLPEPGCSSPTFTGSAADVDHHASGLLNIGLVRASTLAPDAASLDLAASSWSGPSPVAARLLSYSLPPPVVGVERKRGYRVFSSAAAERGMAGEIRRTARTRSSKVETGGLMFGEIDDAHGRIWIDGVSGPPADSEMSPERFVCGTAGTVALTQRRVAESGGRAASSASGTRIPCRSAGRAWRTWPRWCSCCICRPTRRGRSRC